jgi:hypothetical protein
LSAWEAGDTVDCIEQHAAENRAKAGHGVPQRQGLGIVVLGRLQEKEFEVFQPPILIGDEGQIDRNSLWHSAIITALSDALTVGVVGDVFAERGPGILAGGMWHLGQEFSAFAQPVGAAPEHVTGRPHLGRRDRGVGEHPTAQQGGNLVRVDLVVFGRATGEDFHGKRMTEDEGDACVSTQVSEPIPGEEACNGNNQSVAVRGNGLEKGFGGCWHIAVEQHCSVLLQDADGQGAGMQVDATVKLVLIGVESH